MPSVLEQILAVQRGEVPAPPIAALLGLRLVHAEAGKATFELVADERHANPRGALHGGILCDLGDAAMGVAFATTCEPEDAYATIQLQCHFLRPFWKGHLTAQAHMVYRGRTSGLAECDITDKRERLIAKLSSTLVVLQGDQAKGR